MRPARHLIAAWSAALSIGASAAGVPEQTPDVGTNEQVWSAVDKVWKIRASKKWGDALDTTERAAVTLALEAFDDFIMNKGVAYFTPQLFAQLFSPQVVSATRIRVKASDQLYAHFEPADRSIEISMGFLAALYWTQLAVEEARENPRLRPYLPKYLFALSRNNFQRTPISASSVIRLTEFVNGSPWRPNNELTNQVDNRAFEAVKDGLIFVIAHEGCHTALGHTYGKDFANGVRQEWQADECATVRAGPPGLLHQFNPYLPLAVVALAGLDDNGKPKQFTTHPNALCRMGWMIYNGGNAAPSIKYSLELFPLLVELYGFKAADPTAMPTGYDHPNFLAVAGIASYCGGWSVLNPRGGRTNATRQTLGN